MRSVGLLQESSAEEKEKVCNQCRANASLIKSKFGFAGYDLSSQLDSQSISAVEEHLKSVTPENFQEFKLEGIGLGVLALYEFLLQHKKSDLKFNAQEWWHYLGFLRNTLFSFYAGRTILEKEKPSAVLTYNNLYAVNSVVCQLAEKRGVPSFNIVAGPSLRNRLQGLLIGRGNWYELMKHLKARWPTEKNIPCSQAELDAVTEHFLELFKGRHVLAYSSPKEENPPDIREIFGIKKSQKVLLAALSSQDEFIAAEKAGLIPINRPLLFSNDIDWIKALIKFVRNRPDLFLIIRVHPREFPNKREGQKSQHAEQLERELQNLPANVRVNYPADNLSLYNIAGEADVLLNCWSSVGKELALLGTPVVIYSDMVILYPADLNFMATTETEYFRTIDVAIASGWDFERVRKAFRWHALEYYRSVLDISDSCHLVEYPPGILQRALRKVAQKVDPLYLQKRDLNHRVREMRVKSKINAIVDQKLLSVLDSKDLRREHPSLDEETRLIKNELRRITQALYPQGEKTTVGRPLNNELKKGVQ